MVQYDHDLVIMGGDSINGNIQSGFLDSYSTWLRGITYSEQQTRFHTYFHLALLYHGFTYKYAQITRVDEIGNWVLI